MDTQDKLTFGGLLVAVMVLLLPFVDSTKLFYGAVNSKAFFVLGVITLLAFYAAYRLWFERQNITIGRRWLFFSVLLFIATNYTASLFGVYPAGSLWGDILRGTGVFFVTYLGLLALFAGVFLTSRDWNMAKWSIAISGGLFGLLSFFGRDGFGITGRFLGINLEASGLSIGNTTFAGAFLLITFIVTLIVLLRTKERRWQIVLAVLALLQIASPFLFSEALWSGIGLSAIISNPVLLLGAARASSVTVFAVLVYMIGFFALKRLVRGVGRKYITPVWGGAWLLLMTVAIGLLFTPGSVVQERYAAESTAARVIVWESGLQAFTERPVLGWGPENFRLADDKYFDNRLSLDENVGEIWFDRAHNIIVDTLVATGVIGVLVILFILVMFVRTIVRARKRGFINQLEAQLLCVLPFAHFLQLQTSFDTVVTYTIVFVMLGYAIWLEGRMAQAVDTEGSSGTLFRRGIALVLTILVFVGSWNVLVRDFVRQRALFAVFTTPSAEEQIKLIEVATSRPGGFEHLRLASGSFIKGFVESIGNVPQENRPDVIAIGLQQMDLYESRYQEYLIGVPNDYRARMNYAYLLLTKTVFGDNNLTEAENLIAESYKLSPNNQLTYAMDALTNFYGGNVSVARERISEGIALNPEAPIARDVSDYIEGQIPRIPNIRPIDLKNL